MRFRFLLKPGWLALTALVFVFAAVCFTVLSPWQFGRNDDRDAQNKALAAALRTDAVPLEQLLPTPAEPASGAEWRQVTMTGHYLPDGETLARLRTVQGEAAYEVLTPFQLSGGGQLLVDRGYVRPVNGNQVPDYAAPPSGEVTLTARVRVDENTDRDAFTEGGHRQVYAVSSAAVGKAVGLDLRPGYFQLVEGQPGVLGALPLPTTEAGPFLSYALQWIAFGAMAVLAWIYFTVREVRPGGALSENAGGQADQRTEPGEPDQPDHTAQAEPDQSGQDQSGQDQSGQDQPGQSGQTQRPAPRYRPVPAARQPKKKRARRLSVAEMLAEDEAEERAEAERRAAQRRAAQREQGQATASSQS
uniref:SURF1 family cytochrome oxidase biogenesis protein n=1 Tax=Goodfellowiella coeruleoviolacea TaxID=334858 RepID=UPI0027E1C3E9|nr:SURF1 family cytochrome oxidase biogenesis protein [Goodfellowiella coeruleoviolacea]